MMVIDTISGRQHLAASDMHKMEITAAATVMHRMIPVRGVLQEARVPQELGTPIYIDCAAPKKSTWVRRKSEELNECHELGRSEPIKIDECDNFADPQTKYLTTKVWLRHLHYTHNISGEPPPVAAKNKKMAAVLTTETPWGETLD